VWQPEGVEAGQQGSFIRVCEIRWPLEGNRPVAALLKSYETQALVFAYPTALLLLPPLF